VVTAELLHHWIEQPLMGVLIKLLTMYHLKLFLGFHAVRIWHDHKQDSKGNADFRIGSDLPLSHCFSEVIIH
jgi:hypothetical protein